MTFWLNRTNFYYIAITFGRLLKSATNVTCLEFLQFFQISLAASTNWCLKLNFYSISDNKYNKFDSFFKENKNPEVLE